MSLAAVAGAVNACGICALGIYTATMTPAATALGTSLARGELSLALQALLLIAAFVLGAIVAATLQLHARQSAVLAWPLMAQAAALVMFVALWPDLRVASGILAFAMGIQNAALTRVHGSRVRTTHVTSVWTDAGRALAIAVLAWHAGRKGLLRLSLRRLVPRVAIVSAFLLGAIGAFCLYPALGPGTLLLPAIAALGIAYWDFTAASRLEAR